MSEKSPKRPITMEEIARWHAGRKEEARKSPAARHLASVLAERAREKGGGPVQVSLPELEDQTGLPGRTMRHVLRKWEEESHIRRIQVGGKPGKGRREGNEIELIPPEEEDDGVTNQDKPRQGPPSRAGPRKRRAGSLKAPAFTW